MSPIAIGLDLLLASLLVGALFMGWRLNGRLKALRASQLDFAKAVMELDAAAARAEVGLTQLRAASEEAHDSLLARIDTARALATRLEKAEGSADSAARRAEAAAAEVKALPARTDTPGPRPLRETLAALEEQVATIPARPTPRRRNIADEALFADAEAEAPASLKGLLRMSLGSRR